MLAGGFQIGDPNFMKHDTIVASKAEEWRRVVLPQPLQPETDAAGQTARLRDTRRRNTRRRDTCWRDTHRRHTHRRHTHHRKNQYQQRRHPP